MKNLFIILLAIATMVNVSAHGGKNYEHSDIFKNLQPQDKVAILMVHFGTTHNDTRALTIDALNERAQAQFPDVELREAYTARIVIKRLGERGIVKQKPVDVLTQLQKEGYTHILVQPSTIIDGVEMESLEKDIASVQPQFKEIRIGDPLLYSPEDYEKLIDVLTKNQDSETAYVWIGHGTYDSNTAQYAMLDYMLKAKGHKNCFVGTIEGYPSYDDMLLQLTASGLKKVQLVPLMFVAGEHAKNDIAEDWKTALEKDGYLVDVKMEGLGQNTEVQDLYISHLKFISGHRKIGILEKKAIYEITGEKME